MTKIVFDTTGNSAFPFKKAQENGFSREERKRLIRNGLMLRIGRDRVHAYIVPTEGVALIERNYGGVSPKGIFTIKLNQLIALNEVISHWNKVCHEWHILDFFFNGVSASFYYYPPGINSEKVNLGFQCYGYKHKRADFAGIEELRPLDNPINISQNVVVKNAIYRTNEPESPEGLYIGLEYLIPDAKIKAYRHKIRIYSADNFISIEPHEVDFVKEISVCLARRYHSPTN